MPPLARRAAGAADGANDYAVCLTDTQSGTASAVGLLACSKEGRVRYWERLTLSGADEFVDMPASLDLHVDGDGGVTLVNCEVRHGPWHTGPPVGC